MLQPSTSMNGDSLMRVPASPISFSSNNISGSSVIDGCIMQQSPPQEQVQKQRSSSVTSQPVIDAGGALHAQKKSRIDVCQGGITEQQLIQQLLHGQNSLHYQGQQNPQLQALMQHHKLAQLQQRQQQHPFSQMQQPQVGIPRQPQLRPPLAQTGMQLGGPVRSPIESGICSRRILQYLYHKRHRPENNPITYWRKLVEEYFAPRARERWCVSSYENRGNSSAAAPQKALDTWRCGICNTHGGKGYEVTYEVLPRLCQIRFDHGVIDEYLYFDSPNEFRLPNGQMVLEHAKVVQKSVYEHLHVIHEGHLRIIFTPELKIMSWEFCSRRHEEYTTRKTIAPQVNNLLQVAQKFQAVVSESGSAGISNNDAQTICNMFVNASRQLAKNLEHHTLNEHGLSKRYVRCLQISEVVNHMKDLIEFSHKSKLGPKESLNSYSKTTAKFENMHDSRQAMAAANLANNQSNTKLMGVKQETSTSANNQTPGAGAIGNNNLPIAAPLNTYQNMLRSSGASTISLQQEASSVFKGPTAMHNGMQLEAARSFLGPNQVQFQHHPPSSSFQQQQQNSFHGFGVNPQYQQHVLNQLLQEVKNSNNRSKAQQPPLDAPPPNASGGGLAPGVATPNVIAATGEQGQHVNNSSSNHNGTVKGAAGTGPSNVINNSTASMASARNSSFKSVSSSPAAAGNAVSSKVDDSFHQLEDLDDMIANELVESGLFGAGHGW
ncbi:probable transcriptional regulator SLK2-like isoform X1 [Zea mays]|uniref:Putative transcriptional regulator SLK2 n=1 Tax=Zea mays TaxID=4577 RepID=K7V7M9_MAIZE|nr:uncharacterized protein LOC100280226 isoform X1 [Zea mays]AQL02462.1 putative transcriptional regulator SLK2 [Zea mays]AQL02464.1 putative transcriptional regulator SLK2 [Zea mays]|eukprot:XP_008658523.1 putative transcriptional regulator SLK2 isoform X1 [Zea mays]